MIKPNFENIPSELKARPQWVNWRLEKRNGKMTKPPYQPYGQLAATDNPETWNSFPSVMTAVHKFKGVGFVLTNDDPFVALDFDNCRCPGLDGVDPISRTLDMVQSEIAHHLLKLNAYTEVSPSGRGIRVILKGYLPVPGKKKGNVEVYQSGRYVTITGQTLDGFPPGIEDRTAEITNFYEAVFGTNDSIERLEQKRLGDTIENLQEHLERAFQSPRGSVIRRLWEGDYSEYPSHSEADLGLCSHLAYWLNGNREAIDTAFRKSGLMRNKWDEKHYANGKTYGEATISKALDGCPSFDMNLQQKEGLRIDTSSPKSWPQPIPLPSELPPVEPFDIEMLPRSLKPWAADITERFQCPSDFLGAAIMASLGSVVGCKIGIRPQAQTDWTVIPNIWALIVGRPGVMKSPAMEAALSPLKLLAAQAVEHFDAEHLEYEKQERVCKLKAVSEQKRASMMLKKNPNADVTSILTTEKIEEPTLRRYIVNDTTVAALGELLRHNQNGFLTYRDEMVSLLKGLDREDAAGDRGFYLTAWNGDSSYTIDRIGRGMNLCIPAVCLSLLGSTQPARLAEYIRHAVRGTAGDDGLIQRFSMLVWPDVDGDWRDVDRWPDHVAKHNANKVFKYLDKLNPLEIGAIQDKGLNGEPEGIPYLRFDDDARKEFLEWRTSLESNLRGGGLSPALESHFSKYRKLIPGLALLIHLADGKTGPVGVSSVLAALAWGVYLQTHARRAYASITTPDITTAKTILLKLKRGDIEEPFSARDIYRNGWTGLSEPWRVRDALTFLEDRDWLTSSTTTRERHGGRPQTIYVMNPRVLL